MEDYPKATHEDIQWVLNEISKLLVQPITEKDILATWCGIRPLITTVILF